MEGNMRQAREEDKGKEGGREKERQDGKTEKEEVSKGESADGEKEVKGGNKEGSKD